MSLFFLIYCQSPNEGNALFYGIWMFINVFIKFLLCILSRASWVQVIYLIFGICFNISLESTTEIPRFFLFGDFLTTMFLPLLIFVERAARTTHHNVSFSHLINSRSRLLIMKLIIMICSSFLPSSFLVKVNSIINSVVS